MHKLRSRPLVQPEQVIIEYVEEAQERMERAILGGTPQELEAAVASSKGPTPPPPTPQAAGDKHQSGKDANGKGGGKGRKGANGEGNGGLVGN